MPQRSTPERDHAQGHAQPPIGFGFRCAIVVTLLALSLLPLFRWLPGADRMTRAAAPSGNAFDWYMNAVSGWLFGAIIVVGAAVVLAIFSQRWPVLWRDGLFGQPRLLDRPWLTATLLATAAFAVYLLIGWIIFDFRPLIVDAITELMQARIFSSGHLWQPTAAHPEFFSSMLMIDKGGRSFSQFPPGGPALLALGDLVRAPWLVGPICGGVAVAAYFHFLRTVREENSIVLGATLLFAFAPFAAFMAGSYMSHTPTLMWLMLGCAALAVTVTREQRQFWPACLMGLSFGMAATIRAPGAMAFALPAGAWLLVLTIKRRLPISALLGAGVGILLPIAGMLCINTVLNGAPLRFGYQVQWGKDHGFGFHRSPWGAAHTPMRGLALTNLDFIRLQIYLFESPLPALLPALGAFALTRRWRSFDRYLLVSAAILVGMYFAYWFDALWLGPRYYHALLPLLALWTARLPRAVRERFGRGQLYRGVVYGGLVAMLMSACAGIPTRIAEYKTMMFSARWNAEHVAEQAGIHNALVFVRVSWGAQLLPRMWALAVPRPQAEFYYNRIDACLLETTITDLEQHNERGAAAVARLAPLVRDSSLVVGSPFSPDTSERYLPGTTYTPRCKAHADEDRVGTWVLAPALLGNGDDNLFARDLGPRNRLLAAEYPNRPIYLLHPTSTHLGVAPQFFPLQRDSALRAWNAADDDAANAASALASAPPAPHPVTHSVALPVPLHTPTSPEDAHRVLPP